MQSTQMPFALDPLSAVVKRPAVACERLFVLVDLVPCQVCNSKEDTDFLLCDGCNGGSHLACVGLESVPAGFWVCTECLRQPTVDSAVRQVCLQGMSSSKHCLLSTAACSQGHWHIQLKHACTCIKPSHSRQVDSLC